MGNLVDAALGIPIRALTLGARRLELIANNMANSDTPGFKARDIDFRATLAREANEGGSLTLSTTEAGHIQPDAANGGAEVKYRIPNTPSLDGNTVDTQLEQSAFSEAAVRYQASLDFLNNRIAGLRSALRGQ